MRTKAPFEIKRQTTLWVVTFENGVYSDRSIRHLYFRGASKEEIWRSLCRYIDDVYATSDPRKDRLPVERIILAKHEDGGMNDGGARRHKVKGSSACGCGRHWDPASGCAYLVRIKRMDVIEPAN